MAKCQITEYKKLAKDDEGNILPIGETEIATQSVSYTSSTASSAFNADTRWIRVSSDAAVHLSFGPAPTATVASTRLGANFTDWFRVQGGQKVACYDGTT